MNKLFSEKYLYLVLFLTVAACCAVQMTYFSRFLSNTGNYAVFTAWSQNQQLREDIHRHPERYPDLNPDGTPKTKSNQPAEPAEKPVKPEISNAFTLSDKNMNPFLIGDALSGSITDISSTLDKPAGKYGFIAVKDGHFHNGKGRFQIAGINNAYEANFPSKEYAEIMAKRLARFGFNCVRLHHCDEKGFWTNSPNKTVFNETKLDLFDYNIYALKRQGIYVNINLHCSRFLGHAEGAVPSGVIFDKGIDQFDPAIRDLDKKFAYDLLNHVNPYTGNAYKDEPAVAAVELNNENSICQIWRNNSLENADPYYLRELQGLWNEYLVKKYKTDETLRQEAGFAAVPFGGELLNGTAKHLPKNLVVKLVNRNNTVQPLTQTIADGVPRLTVTGTEKDARQLVYDGLKVKKGQLYTFSVVLRSDVPSSILLRYVHSSKTGRTTKIYTEAQFETCDFPFIAARDDENFRLSIGGFLTGVCYEIESLSFREGGTIGYPKPDDRVIAVEESFDVYTTSLVNNQPLRTLASINLSRILDGAVAGAPAELHLRAGKNQTYRVDLLVDTLAAKPLDIAFTQGEDTKLNVTENYSSFEKAGKPYVLSYNVESQHNRPITLSLKNTDRPVAYRVDLLQVKPAVRQSNEKISLDSLNIPLLFYTLISRYPAQLQDDWCEFLMEVDKNHWKDMYRYLKETIGVKQPVTGTQIEYGSMHAQADMDYCDIHGYWDHPVFPNYAWNNKDWFCHNQPMINVLDQCPLLNMATKRVMGKPFTCSEYGHIWINRYAAEGLPLLSLFGSRHGWDGLYPFCYDDGTEPASKSMYGYFVMRNNTVQLAHQIACNNLITRDYAKDTDKTTVVAPLSEAKELELFKLHQHTYSFGFNGLNLDFTQALVSPTAIDTTGAVPTPKLTTNVKEQDIIFIQNDGGDYLHYNKQTEQARWLSVSQGKTQVFTGFFNTGQTYPFGRGTIQFGASNMDWATVTMTEIRKDAEGSIHYLLAVTGEMRNTEQEYQKVLNNKITLNNSGIDTYGKAPILCECLSAIIDTGLKNNVIYYPLDETGNRVMECQTKAWEDTRSVYLDSAYGTIWYEIVVEQNENNTDNRGF